MAGYITPCPHCGHLVEFPANHQPGPGEAIECKKCHGVGMYTDGAELRKPTPGEMLIIELYKLQDRHHGAAAPTPTTLATHPRDLNIDERIRRARSSRYN